MPTYISQLGEQLGGTVANTALGGIFGAIMQKSNDKRQIRQQRKLQDMQLQGNKEMVDYNMMKELEMWNNTNYGAQIKHLKDAGLNPALIYGMKGGGGATVGSPGGGGVSGGTAPVGGGEVQQGAQYGIQSAMAMANIELMKSQANKNNVEAAKTGGVDTDLARTQILDLTQGIENKKAQEILTRVQTRIGELDAQLKGMTQQDVADRIAWEAGKALEEMAQAENETFIQRATMNNKIDMVKAELAYIYLKNTLTTAQTTNVNADTKLKGAQTDLAQSNIQVNEVQMRKMAADISQGWQKLEVELRGASVREREIALKEFVQDVSESTKLTVEAVGNLIDGVMRKMPKRTHRSTDGSRGWKDEVTTEHY